MTTLRYGDGSFEMGEGQSVLDCLTEQGASIPSSCRSGACQTCLMRATSGQPPEASQAGLSDALRLQNHFLACLCQPTEDLTVTLPDDAGARVSATIRRLERLNADIMLVALEPHGPLDYRPGQFINLYRNPELGRSYSIASLPTDEHIHLHIRRLPGGRVSGWIHEALQTGHTVEIRGPLGQCIYVPGRPEQPLLLIGTGSGLAPLYGIIRDALAQGHTGPIRLFHGSREPDGLYLADELKALNQTHVSFDYRPCVSGPHAATGFAAGRAHDIALSEIPNLKGWRVFLCGHPDMVQQAQVSAFLAGAASQDILTDPFLASPQDAV